jgi:hypothetical protein
LQSGIRFKPKAESLKLLFGTLNFIADVSQKIYSNLKNGFRRWASCARLSKEVLGFKLFALGFQKEVLGFKLFALGL